MATISAAFRPGYVLRLEFWFGGVSGRSIPVFYEAWIDKAPGYSGYWNQNGQIQVWGIDGSPRTFGIAGADFRGGGTGGRSFLMASGSGWATYGADGNYRYATGVIATLTDLGTAHPGDGAIDAPYIGPAVTVPSAATIVSIDGITPTGMTVHFSGSASNGGSPITNYALQRADDVNFTSGVAQYNTLTGTNPISGLVPGRTYFWRVIPQNAVGNGPVSNVVSAKTLTGSYGSVNGGAYAAGEVRVSVNGGAYAIAEVLQSVNGSAYANAG